MYAIQIISVVYFDQRMGVPHAVSCLKSFVSALKQEEIKRKESARITRKNMHKRGYKCVIEY